MNTLKNAARVNQAYQETYGPASLLNEPITRELAANQVIARRSAFPAIATKDYFVSPKYNTLQYNMNMTAGLNLKDRETFRSRKQPGQIENLAEYDPTTAMSSTNTIFMYTIGIVLLITVIYVIF
jgi:hypothetical protein